MTTTNFRKKSSEPDPTKSSVTFDKTDCAILYFSASLLTSTDPAAQRSPFFNLLYTTRRRTPPAGAMVVPHARFGATGLLSLAAIGWANSRRYWDWSQANSNDGRRDCMSRTLQRREMKDAGTCSSLCTSRDTYIICAQGSRVELANTQSQVRFSESTTVPLL